MTASLDEFRTRIRTSPEGQSRIAELKGMAQEAPRMAALTGSADWDLYLRYVEAHIKAAERMVELKRDQAAALVLLDEDKAKAAAVLVAAYQSRLETLRQLILIPKWIRESGAEAAKAVVELESSL